MKIKKYIKTGKNKYKIELEDNSTIILHEDIILNHELLLKKEINDIDKILQCEEQYELYDKVLSYINKRIRCESEIRKYLKKYTSNDLEISEIINKLYNNKLLDNNLYIKSFIHDKITFTNDGPLKIKENLLNLEFDSFLIDDLLIEFNDSLQNKKINNYISKYLKSNKKSLRFFKQKMLFNLLNLGYEKEIIIANLDKIKIDEDSLLLKEKEKLLKKYSKKYNGIELENIIKRKLYEKGYRNVY